MKIQNVSNGVDRLFTLCNNSLERSTEIDGPY